MSRPSLGAIASRYGQSEKFGHQDYAEAIKAGYSASEIKAWLDEDLNRLNPVNRTGGTGGLYDEISRGAVDLSKASNIDRGYSEQGMTPFEYEYQKAIDLANIQAGISPETARIQSESASRIAEIQKESALGVANIDKQIKEMQLESAENLQKLSNASKLTLANVATNQGILTGLVSAFNF